MSAYPGDGLLLGGWTLSGGLVLDWFAGPLRRRALTGRAAAAWPRSVDTGGVVALPYLAGERTPLWDPDARGAVLGLALDSGPEHVYRALVESLALAVRDHTERIERALGPLPGLARRPAAAHETACGCRPRPTPWARRSQVSSDAAEAVGPGLLALRALGFDPQREPVATIEPDPASAAALRLHACAVSRAGSRWPRSIKL